MRWRAVLRFIIVTLVLLGGVLMGVRAFYTYVVVAPYTKDEMLQSLHLLSDPQPAKVYREPPPDSETGPTGPASFSQIVERGTLRVCYMLDDYPAAFFNAQDELVGFDIDMAHRLGRYLNLALEFVPLDTLDSVQRVNTGYCDVVMSGLPVLPESARRLDLSVPLLKESIGFIVKDHRRDEFATWEGIQSLGNLRIAMPDNIAARRVMGVLLPGVETVPLATHEDQRRLLESDTEEIDAIVDTAEEAAAWTILYPHFTVAVPRPVRVLPIAYAVARGNRELLDALNAWLLTAKENAVIDGLHDYWMQGKIETVKPPRWSVIRDVLGWVD